MYERLKHPNNLKNIQVKTYPFMTNFPLITRPLTDTKESKYDFENRSQESSFCLLILFLFCFSFSQNNIRSCDEMRFQESCFFNKSNH